MEQIKIIEKEKEGWISKGSVDEVNIEIKRGSKSTIACSRGSGNIPFPSWLVKDFIFDVEHKKEYDNMLKDSRIIEKFDDNCGVVHDCFKGIFPTAPRDVLYVAYWEKDNSEEDTYYVVAYSTERDDVPVKKGYVRMNLILGGWILRPDKNNPQESMCFNLSMVDLNGDIPKVIVETIASGQPKSIFTMTKVISKHQEKYRKAREEKNN